jgi:hypothetical protein
VSATTTRLALPYPTGTDPANVPADMQRLANALDAASAVFVQNTAANRPAASVSGRLFLATDTGAVYYDTGSAWIQLNLNAAATVTAKGDLLVASGAGALARLGAGSDGQLLQAQSGATNGLQWANILGLPLALAGAAAATRFVGGTTSGAPTTGTFAKGDLVIDQVGRVWICTVAGSPGTWVADYQNALGQSLTHTGALSGTQYAGGTVSGPPTSGTFAKGDFIIAQDGVPWICTAAGTPGTWRSPAMGAVGRLRRTSGNLATVTASSNNSVASAASLVRLAVPVVSGRLYRISAEELPVIPNSAPSGPFDLEFHLHVTTDGSNPTTSSTSILQHNATFAAAGLGVPDTTSLRTLYPAAFTGTLTILMTALIPSSVAGGVTSANVTASTGNPFDLVVEDLGADPGATGTVF